MHQGADALLVRSLTTTYHFFSYTLVSLTLDEARVHVKSGYTIVPWLSTDEGRDPGT